MTSPIQLISTDFDGTIFAEFENPPIPQRFVSLIGDLQTRGATFRRFLWGHAPDISTDHGRRERACGLSARIGWCPDAATTQLAAQHYQIEA